MKITTASLGTAILATFVMGVAAGQQAEEHLSNADIVTLVEAGLTPSAIVASPVVTARTTTRQAGRFAAIETAA